MPRSRNSRSKVAFRSSLANETSAAMVMGLSAPRRTSHSRPNVLHVSAEVAPHAKTGGLGDMVRAMAKMLSDNGVPSMVLVPAYEKLIYSADAVEVLEIGSPLGMTCQLVLARQDSISLAMIRCDRHFRRAGGIYTDRDGKPWNDNAVRFALLGKVAAMIAGGQTPIPAPNIVHLHDWHPGLYFAFNPPAEVRTVLTVHNFAFHGRFDDRCLGALLPFADDAIIKSAGLFGGYSPLKIACDRADIVTTVSEGYRRELQCPNRFNWYQLSERNRKRLRAIPNWSDRSQWNPGLDSAIRQRFDSRSLHLRDINRVGLATELELDPDMPIACTVSRITGPKGFKFLLNNLDVVLRAMNLVIVGDGEPKLIARLKHALTQSSRIKFITPYTEASARRTLAGSDFLLMPSLVEPCGLTQMHAQAYGCVPITSETGGLTSSVKDAGFLFQPSDRRSLENAIKTAVSVFAKPDPWRSLRTACMNSRANHTDGPKGYIDCYETLFETPSNPSSDLDERSCRSFERESHMARAACGTNPSPQEPQPNSSF